MTKAYTKKLLLPLLLLFSLAGVAQEYNNFEVRYQDNIKGDLTFIGNNILNRDEGPGNQRPGDPYDNLSTDGTDFNTETGGALNYNDFKDMQYINVDPDGTNNRSSSTATLAFPNPDCNQIRYAGLYWSATYPSATANGSYDGVTYTPNTVAPGTGRLADFNQVRFRVPGGAYVNVTADEILYDGFTDPALQSNSPYACYADVTALVTALADPTGDYTTANIRATTGALAGQGGSTGGWTLVVVYENPTLSGKLITTFDGFARVRNSDTVSLNYNGFTTIPVGPVRADLGAAALEGDFRIPGDGMSISTPANPIPTQLSNGVNPATNFFNSNITLSGAVMAARNPNSTNTLGYDTDIFTLNNPANSVIDNNETSATFQFSTNGDQYYPFFNSFNIEIIEPDIILEKRVEDIAGNDITGLGVNLGQILDYVLTFQNIGNDDGDNYTIRDVLPINVTLDELNMVLPTGVTYTFTPATRTVVFSIPNNIVEEGDTERSIRMRVQVAENCFDFIDACTDLIQNLAFSTYQGVVNNNQITDDPSVTEFNNCQPPTPGATNFLLDDLSDCNFRRTVQLCGDSIVLDAGDNFDSYIWVSDDNNNGLLDPTDTVLNDGDPDGDPSTLVVSTTGTYIVDKIVADPCKGFKEIFDVELFGATQNNPIVDWFNTLNGDADPTNDVQGQIVQCSVDGDFLPQIFLCGNNDSQLIEINISDAQSIEWELLDEGSCTAAPDDCANKNQTCTWNQVGTGSDFTANSAGKYRLIINYQNGCFSRFYFDVYQNNLDIEFNKNDIICTTDGNITITNLGANYGYQLVDVSNNSIVVPFSANNGPSFDFTTGQNGSYRVDVVQLDGSGNPIAGACVFSTPDIGILERDFQVEIETTPANCNDLGTIKIDVLNVDPNYTYTLRLADGTLVDDETAQPDNTYTFEVNPGDYIVETSTDDGCFDTQNITVARAPDPVLSAVTTANIGCTAGTIDLTVTGGLGNPDFNYAIWSKDGTQLYTTVGDIPGGAYQVEDTFTFGWRDTNGDLIDEYFPGEDGDYVFVVVDANNCFAFSNEVTILDLGVLTIDSITETQPSCSGTNDGAITINILGGIGPFQYSIDDGATYQSTPNFVNLSAGPYNIRVLDSSGCDVTTLYDLSEPFPLSASVGVSRDASCDPNGAEVRITNVTGGTPPYTFSFDGGATFGATTTAILPAGTYTVVVRDASCDFPMTVTVEDEPTPPLVTLTPEVNYNCDGSAVITATPDITTYDYTYELDGVLNTPPTSNVWDNIAPGTYTVRTNYVSQTPPAPSLLLSEDFGYGATIPNPNTSGYFYENQADDVTPSGAPIDNNRSINDYEYAVTDSIARPFSAWINPMDHTTGTRATDGRYLVINIGAPTPGQVIYQMPINDIIANQPISVSMWLINLIRSTRSLIEPDLTIELRHPVSGAVVATANTGAVPNNELWNEYVLSLDPGTNTALDLVITTNESEISGNDVAIDDITVFQIPEVCSQFVELPVVVEAGRTFAASVTAFTSVSCNGLNDATITFEVENFDTTAGFEYSIDGGGFIAETTSPVTTSTPIGAGPHTIVIRKADETTCSVTLNQTINEPAAVLANASITTALNCTNGGATITASATGGTPTYIYQLENTGGTPIASYDFATNNNNTVFTGLAAGDYIVRARDANNCEDPIDVALTIAPTNPVEFTVIPTACYFGANDATIQVDVTNGNGDYTFSINGNPWVTPTPANSTTHTFTGLASGSYTINVQDGSGCTGVPIPIDIEPQLTVTASAPNITACATSTDITISAAGGDGNYIFAVVPNATAPTAGDFSTTNPVTVNAAGDYDVHVRDNSGNTGFCSAVYTITIVQDPPIAITPTPTDVTCFGGSDGAISIVVDSGGNGPFTYSIDNGVTYQVGTNFPNLIAGTYPVRVRDANLCESTPIDVDVNEPAQLAAEAAITQNYTCLLLGQITVGNITPTSGGSGNYQYSINGGAWTASTTGGTVFIDLTDGTYSIRVRDANAISCELTLADIIIPPLPTEPTLTTSVAYNCDGTGEVTVLPNDPTYTYSIDAGAFQSPNLFSNVAVGTHTITVNYGSDCTVDTTVIVEDGNAFEASITAFENLDCNSDNSGTITITADNFGVGGFEYSLDATTFVGPFTAAEQITGLSAQAYTITVRDVDNPIAGCTVTLNQTLTEPAPVLAAASITEEFTCNNTGATITASASGGTPPYVYQLEDGVGGVITAYQIGTTFTNLAAGDYIVRARDTNLCEDPIDAVITVVAPVNPTFTVTPTACYSGNNDAEIQVDVTSVPGNGGFQFSINSGPWMTPIPTTAVTYTFDSLANGTYTIDVRDAYGCPAVQETVTINPILTAVVDVVDVTTCADGSITVNASGGDGSYQYAFVPTTSSPTGLFGPSNTFAVTAGNEGTFDVYVRDNSATVPFCEYVETVTVDPATPLTITTTPTDPLCHDGVGSIEVNVSSGDIPYTIQIIDLDNGGASDQTDTNILIPITNYYNLATGNYTIIVTDSNSCNVTNTPVTINNPDELTGDVVPILPAACGSVDPNDYGFQFVSYPTTLGTIEFSADSGTTWTGDNSTPGTSDVLLGYISGTNVFPSMRTIDGSGNTVCQTDLPRYTIPYPLDDLDISISTVVVGCNELQVTVQGTAGVPNYEYTYTDDPANFVIGAAVWTAPVPGAHTWTGLIPGRTYVFYVRDSTGCIRQSNVNVNDITTNPLEITSTYEPSCSGANDAEITYTIVDTDATSHPSMRWEFYNADTGALVQSSGGNIPWNNTITVSSLAPAEYFIVVTEVDGGGVDACVSGSENLLVEELNPITATLNKLQDISCNAPGLISVENINGGGGTFTFTVTGPAPFTTITGTPDNPISIPANSPAGNYNVTIIDQFGCFTDLGPIALTLTPNPTIDTMVVDNCASPTSLTINATSTAASILYSIDGGTTYVDNGGVFNNLTPATYNIAIIDSNGCMDTDTIDIHPVLEANISLTKLLDCTATPDAEITIDVTFGSGNYDYEITNGLGGVVARASLPSNPYVFQTTVPETYTITVFDVNTSSPECNRVFTVVVPPAVIPVLAIDSFTDVTCNGADDGTFSVSATDNGIGPFTFEIISGPGSGAAFPIAATSSTDTNATFTALEGLATPGITYTIRATGSNGCTTDITQVILQPDAIANVNANVVEFACTTANNQNDATITVQPGITGGSGNYVIYEFINDQGTPATGDDVVVQSGSTTAYTETNTAGGTYIINVYDDNGCVGSTTATIAEFVEITDPTVTITQDITCNPGNDAEVTLGVTLNPGTGTPTLNYSMAGTDNAYSSLNQPSNVFTGLGIGNYMATVTNADTGCFVQTTFEIEDPNNFEISTTTVDVVCFGDDGSVSFTINDSVNPYAGGFTWQVYDSQGTAALGDDVIIPAATGVSATVGPTAPFAIPAGEYRVEVTQDSDPSCVNNAFFTIAGPSAAITANVDVTPITCVGNDGIIEIIDVIGGWGNYQYYVGTFAPTVAGDYFATARFENLAPGTYEAWVIDQNGCQQQVQNGIILVDPAPIAGTLQVNQPNCTNFDGEIEVTGVLGGQGSNYTYQLIKDSTPVGVTQNTAVFSGLDAGSYQVQITDQWTCSFTTTAVLLYEPIAPLATVVKTIDCSAAPGGEITITQTGGSGNFDYEVRYPGTLPADPADDTNITGVFTGLTLVGDYVFTITDQAVGHACSTTITQELQPAIIPVINVDAFTDVTCNGADDGTISVSVTDNGVGPYTFEIISGPGSSATFPILPSSSTTTSATFVGLEGLVAPGITYTIRATGSNSCTVDITQIILQPEIIDNVNETVIEFGCTTGNNSDNATITIEHTAITGGSGNYVRYEFINTTTSTTVQDGTNPVYIETDFAGGNYTINVYDDMGCLGSTTTIIQPFIQISDPTITTNVLISCNDNDSEIQVDVTATPTAPAPNLEYTATGTDIVYNSTNATGLFTGLGIGNYIIRVTNLDTSCYVETTHTIADPNVMEVVITKLTDEECLNNGVDDGSFSVAINNYTGNYSYQVYDLADNPVIGFSGTGNTSTPLTISNLVGGAYYVRITQTDAPFCEQDSNVITILAPDAPVSAIINQETSVGCDNDEGSLLVDPEGGEGPYTIVLTNTTTSQIYTETNVEAFIFTSLAAGDYTIEISDAYSCLYSDTITLIRPDPIVANISATTLACYNDNNASVTATVGPRNVTPVYSYLLNTYDDLAGTNPPQVSVGQASDTFINLPAGFYSITVTDDVGCSEETSIVEIVNPEQVTAQLIRTSPLTCTTGVEFELSATGGSGTYEYSEDNITFFPIVGNTITLPQAGVLAAGTYSYFVRDAVNTCEAIRSNEITEDPIEPLVLTLDTTAANINCNGETTAIIYADADGGLGNYQYELYSNSVSPADLIVGPQPTGEFTNLSAGTYWVNVTSEDCTTAPQEIIITEPTPLEFTPEVINVTCNGEEDGSITITLTGGSGGYQYSISPNLDQFDDENVFDELAPGDYTVIAQDQNGCFVEYPFTITQPEILEMTVTTLPEICAGNDDGSAIVAISGGTAPYSTSFGDNTNFVQDQVDFTDLAAGSYLVYIRDAMDCETNIIITIDSGVNLAASVVPVYECTGDTPNNYVNITLEDESVLGDVLYALDSSDASDMQLNPDFRDIAPGTHYIAISHSNGCVVTIDFEILAFEPLTLTLEQNEINVITALAEGGLPNYRFVFDGIDNGTNNTFVINRTDTYVVTVIDENGCEVTANIFMEFIDIEIPNFFTPDGDGLNDRWLPRNIEQYPEILIKVYDRYGRVVEDNVIDRNGWDGKYNQSELPSGDYWYVVQLNGERDDREFVGHFTLYR